MKKIICKIALLTLLLMGTFSLAGCAQLLGVLATAGSGDEAVSEDIITENEWISQGDGSLLVCETDGTFMYYQSPDDLTNYYFDGTYEFLTGEDAVTYLTTTLSNRGITRDELEDLFERTEEYDVTNFILLILNNESCMIDGENILSAPLEHPYYGFYLEDDGESILDLASANTGEYHTMTER